MEAHAHGSACGCRTRERRCVGIGLHCSCILALLLCELEHEPTLLFGSHRYQTTIERLSDDPGIGADLGSCPVTSIDHDRTMHPSASMCSSYGLTFPPNPQKAYRELCEPLCDSQKLHFSLRFPLDTHEGQAGIESRAV